MNNYKRSEVDYCLFIKKCESLIIYVLVWVDDIIIAASNIQLINETKGLLGGQFKRIKHIDIRYNLIREQVINDCIDVEYLQTDLPYLLGYKSHFFT